MERILHYIHDPLCGWCYAAEKLAETASARAHGRFAIRLHGGGLFARSHLPEAKRNGIRSADTRIGELTGLVFGDAYLDGLLCDPQTVYDSGVPVRGILAAEQIAPGSALAMLKALQHAHYRRGLRIVEPATIAEAAAGIGLDSEAFVSAFDSLGDAGLRAHLDSTRRLMGALGARGFPTFVAQVGSEFRLLPHERFYGDPDGFAELVANILLEGHTA